MPARSSRNNNNNRNARNKKPSSASTSASASSSSTSTPSTDDEQLSAAPLTQHQHQHQSQHRTSPLFSPPAHLPTPLPDELLSSTSLRLSSSPRMATQSSETEYAAEHELPPLGLGLGLLGGGGDNVGGSSTLSHLIDFDTPTPPPPRPTSLPPSSFDSEDSVLDHDEAEGEGEEDDSLAHTYTAQMYRSPPFREAQLPPGEVEASPPPLPVLPRSPHAQAQHFNDAYGEDEDAAGSINMASSTMVVHTRAPTFAMSPKRASTSRTSSGAVPSLISSSSASTSTSTSAQASTSTNPPPPASSSAFDAFSRTIRGYAQGYVPAPPAVSRPVVSGLFSAAGTSQNHQQQQQTQTHRRVVSQQEFEREYERYGAGDEEYGYGYGGGQAQSQPQGRGQESQSQPYGGGYGGGQPQPGPSYGYGYGYGAQGQQQQYHQPQPTPPRVDVRSLGVGAGVYAGDGRGQARRAQGGGGVSSAGSGAGSGLAQAMRRGSAGTAAAGPTVGASDARPSVGTAARTGRSVSGQRGLTRGRAPQADATSWARWDVLDERRVLLLAYPSGLQIWDCADLNAIAEVLNLDFGGADWSGAAGPLGSRLVHAAVLPPPSTDRLGKDVVEDARPLLGIMMESVDQASDTDEFDSDSERVATLVLYSLRHHRVVKTLQFAGLASTFVANEFVVVVGTTAPPTIHILSATTFQTLHVIPASALEPFAHLSLHSQTQGHRTTTSISHSSSALYIPNSSATSNLNANPSSSSTLYQQHQQQQQPVSLTGLSIDERDYNTHTTTSSSHAERHPAPVFALSHRLLAYASPSPAISPSLLSTLTSKASRRLSSSSSASASGRSNAASSLSSSPFNLGAGLGGVSAGLTGGIGGIGAGIEKLSQVTQADVGNAALRVGESMFSGMKFLGGKALEVAKNRVGAGIGTGTGVGARGLTPGGVRRAVRPVSVGDESSLGGAGGLLGAGGGVPAGRLVSRSAPGDSGVGEEALRERYSNVAVAEAESRDRVGTTTVAPQTKPAAEPGHYVTVVDLGPLFSTFSSGQGSGLTTPKKIDEFNASRSRPVAGLSFAHDGTSVGAILRDGHSVKVFKLRPSMLLPGSSSSSVSGPASGSSSDPSDPRTSVSPGTPTITSASMSTQTYDLYRGRTSALIDAPSVVWGRDGRWVGVGTRNRTVHIFAVNPYGGRPDLRSHLDRTRDTEVLEPPMTQIPALVRIRGTKGSGNPSYMTLSPPTPSSAQSDFAQARSKDNTPLAFTFISPADLKSTSPNLLPPSSPGFSSPRIPPSSLSPSSPTFSPRLGGRPASRGGASTTSAPIYGSGNEYPYQDILVFDPLDGTLSLRRLTLGKQPVNDTALPLGLGVGVGVAASAAASAIGMVTSVSLPGRGGAGRLSASSSPSSRTPVVGIGSGRNLSGGSDGRGKAQGIQESEMELTAKESVVATWDLRRARDWVEVRVPIIPKAGTGRRAGAAKIGGTGDWLAQGELSTHSVSPRLLPRSLYLSHQFSFHTLGEDYHALLRGYQFDVSASGSSRRIEVRKEVEVSGGFVGAVGGGTGVIRDDSAFIQDFSFSPQDAHSNAHMRRMPSSFDEPLASAISGTLLNSSSAVDVPAVLPMYPNGIPGTSTSIRNSRAVQIPMRTMAGIGDGVSEGLGRIRRGVGRVREKDGRISEREERVIEDVQVPIPLEFDEEDEDFSGGPLQPSFTTTTRASGAPISSRDTSRSTGGDSTSVSSLAIATPASASSSSHALNMDMDSDVVGRVDEEIWGDAPRGGLLEAEEDGWDRQDRLAIEEAEGYDDLALAAALEASEPVKPAPTPPNPVPAGNLKKKGKKKRV